MFINIVIALCAVPLYFTLLNYFRMRVVAPQASATVAESISILVPMRNEERNVADLLESLQSAEGLPASEFVVLNDNSSDRTAELLQAHLSSASIHVHQGLDLPNGWLGKNFACHQLVTHSHGEYLVFVDADVRLSPVAIASAITTMHSLKWDFISPYPRQIASGFTERLIQPLLQWSWLSSVPLRFAERGAFPSMIIANGQFLIIKRDAYMAAGGHKAIRDEVLDDLELARLLVKNGFKGGVAEGSAVAECRMYQSASELVAGYTKSLWRAFGSPLGSIATALYLGVTGVLPILLGLSGYPVAWLGYFLAVLSRYVTAARTRSTPSTALLHPLSILTLIALIALSWQKKLTGQLEWRGRSII
jgi:glycosyltransferase involved in cell wall biosynthesis